MMIKLYRQISETNKLEKVLTEPLEIEGFFRSAADVLNPNLTIQSTDNLSNYNYMYIPQFGRYYFVDSITASRTNLWEVQGAVDVLMSYSTAIRNLSAVVRRSSSSVNVELKDDKMRMLNRTSIQGKRLVDGFNRNAEFSYVLVVAGKSDPSSDVSA